MTQRPPNKGPIRSRQNPTNKALTIAEKDHKDLINLKRSIKRSNKPKTQRTVKPRSQTRRPNDAFHKSVSHCALSYASALADPIGTPTGACIPFGFPLPSQKVKVSARGTFNLGTTGVGYAQWNPAFTNDTVAVITTQATSVGTVGTSPTSFTNLVNTNLIKNVFTTAQMTNSVNPIGGRIVSGLLRIRYAGTEANRNGIVTTFEEPSHRNMTSTPISTIISSQQTLNERPPPDGAWHSVFYSGPAGQGEINFASTTGITPGAYWAIVQGIANDLYEWEIYQHLEFNGALVIAASASSIDANGYALAVDAMKSISSIVPLSESNSFSAFSTFLKSAGTTMKSVITDIGLPSLASLISPALMGPARSAGRLMLTDRKSVV